jgi:hypothetical protein
MTRSAGTSESATGQRAEQRREPRRAAGGEVVFLFDESLPEICPGEVRAKLLDCSASGFRAQHDCAQLTCGQIVKFRLTKSKGLARVVWTRILGDRVESGFLILRSQLAENLEATASSMSRL